MTQPACRSTRKSHHMLGSPSVIIRADENSIIAEQCEQRGLLCHAGLM